MCADSAAFRSQNILFGSPMEDDRYSAVIDACALKTDLAMFDAGDETGV